MAASKSYLARTNYRFLPRERTSPIATDSMYELDELDVWNSGHAASPEFRKAVLGSRKKPSAKRLIVGAGGTASSLPVNVPDWSKILKQDYRENRRRDSYDDFDDENCDDGGDRIPPHVFLARTRIASYSVHEGIGRTLKGRDLSRVRNAIWEKTGFED